MYNEKPVDNQTPPGDVLHIRASDLEDAVRELEDLVDGLVGPVPEAPNGAADCSAKPEGDTCLLRKLRTAEERFVTATYSLREARRRLLALI